MARIVKAEPLTSVGFAPFGQVLEVPIDGNANSNQGTAIRVDRVAKLVNTRATCAPNLAVVRALPQKLPLSLRLLERHPCSSQAFIPMRCSQYLVVVAPTAADGAPDWNGLRAFWAGPSQGINYSAGCWHHPFTALGGPAELVMLAWEDGSHGDCEETHLPGDIEVVL